MFDSGNSSFEQYEQAKNKEVEEPETMQSKEFELKEAKNDEAFVFFVHNVPTQSKPDKKRTRYSRKIILLYCLFVSLLIIVFWYYSSLEKVVEEDYKDGN